ncbi:hypothetical protein J6590_039072 [Homalodisca vitripennis]|nr:hypothetical protein J6590_039072 [Homalodisca vitripennis]
MNYYMKDWDVESAAIEVLVDLICGSGPPVDQLQEGPPARLGLGVIYLVTDK